MKLLEGKKGLVFGVANQFSIAWAVAQAAREHGAEVAIGVQNERMKESAQRLFENQKPYPTVIADLNDDAQIESMREELGKTLGGLDFVVHSVAYALRAELAGRFLDTSREGFRIALETSAYSFLAMAKGLEGILHDDASLLTMTYLGSQRVIPFYNVMGVAKAALEAITRHLAYEMGGRGIRVNAISPGPISTVSARGIKGFAQMQPVLVEKAPLKRPAEQKEVASTALYLMSDLSRGVTGQVIYVDSGYHIMGL